MLVKKKDWVKREGKGILFFGRIIELRKRLGRLMRVLMGC